jgi:hypothetical protein
MIRIALHSDIDNTLPLVKSFYDESLKAYGFDFNEDTLRAVMKAHCDNQSALVMEVIDDPALQGRIVGVIAGQFVQFPTSNFKVYQEVIWYVLPDHRKDGLSLFRETEKYCKSIGMQAIIMGNMANLNSDKMAKFYASQNYKPLEVQWVKLL